jgi:hypothetical protein
MATPFGESQRLESTQSELNYLETINVKPTTPEHPTAPERSATKSYLDKFKSEYEKLLSIVTGSTDVNIGTIDSNVAEGLDHNFNDIPSFEHPVAKETLPLKKLKGSIIQDYKSHQPDSEKFKPGVSSLRKSINDFLVSSNEYIISNEMSPLKPGILELASEVEEFFVEKANVIQERERFDVSVDLKRINAFFDGSSMFEELSTADRKIVKKVIDNVYGRGSVVFYTAKRNVPIPNHQKAKFINELNNLKL